MYRGSPVPLVAILGSLVAWGCPPPPVSLCPKPPTEERARLMNPHWERLDPNGVPLSPRWVVQRGLAGRGGTGGGGPLCLPDPEAKDTCGGFPNQGGVPRGKPECNDLGREEPPAFDLVHGFVCNAGRLFTRFAGHLNYMPATYPGLVFYQNHSQPDDDLDFELLPLEHVDGTWRLRREGATARRWLEEGLVPDPELGRKLRESGLDFCLHVEAKYEESVESFSQSWWARFRQGDKATRQGLMPARPAVVTGLLGLDVEHGAFTEIHPAYSLAVQTACGEADAEGALVDTWAVFIRNSGNEGWCSQWDVPHFFDATGGVFALALPAALSGDMEAVELLPSSELLANRPGIARSPALLENGHVVMRFRWPSSLGAQDEVRVHGVVKLRWRPKPGTQKRCVDLAQALSASTPDPISTESKGAKPKPSEESTAEAFLRTLDTPSVRMREVARALDSLPVQEAPVEAPVLPRWGPCPGNAPTCPEDVRPAVADRVAAPLARDVRMRSDFENRICGVAEERARTRAPGIDQKRLGQLLAACRERR